MRLSRSARLSSSRLSGSSKSARYAMHTSKVREQVLNQPCATIITNAALSTKMKVCFVFQFGSMLAFLVKNSSLHMVLPSKPIILESAFVMILTHG